jgi:hypothetical protein
MARRHLASDSSASCVARGEAGWCFVDAGLAIRHCDGLIALTQELP